MPELTVPQPLLTFEPLVAGVAALEKPVRVQCDNVTTPSGAVFGAEQLGTGGAAGYFIYRQQPTAPPEIWDEAQKRWVAETATALDELKPKPFAFQPQEPLPWQGIIVAVGQKDADDAAQFSTGVTGFPQYFVRALFVDADGGAPVRGLSAPSLPLRFLSAGEGMRAGLRVVPDGKPASATQLEVFLLDAGRQVLGTVQIKADGGAGRIEISNRASAAGASAVIRLVPGGDVELEPAAGASVVVKGPLSAGRIHYQPADATTGTPVGTPRWLP
jgi:hypothetical protein